MKKPNILIVMTDQMRASAMGFTGQEEVITPNLDKFARQSSLFKRAVSNNPACTPARASFITGLYPLSHGLVNNDVCLGTNFKTLAHYLNDMDYKCGYIGKWHMDCADRGIFVPPGPRRQGFDDFWAAYNCNHEYYAMLNVAISGSNPGFKTPDNLNLDATKFKYIKVKMKNRTTSTTGQLSFITNSDTTWDTVKSSNFTVTANDGNMTEYLIDMSNVSTWTGTIKQLKLNPATNASLGAVYVDYIGIYTGSIMSDIAYNFTSGTDGWSAYAYTTVSATGGILTVTNTDWDPSIMSPDNLNFDAGKYKYIKILMKNSTKSTWGKIYWTTTTDTTWNLQKSQNFVIKPNSSGYIEYDIGLSQNQYWKGTVKQIRFDPSQYDPSGTSDIDSILITQSCDTTTQNRVINEGIVDITDGYSNGWERNNNGGYMARATDDKTKNAYESNKYDFGVEQNINGWNALYNCTLNTSGGIMTATITGYDMQIEAPDLLMGPWFRYIKIKMKNNTSDTTARIYFTDQTYTPVLIFYNKPAQAWNINDVASAISSARMQLQDAGFAGGIFIMNILNQTDADNAKSWGFDYGYQYWGETSSTGIDKYETYGRSAGLDQIVCPGASQDPRYWWPASYVPKFYSLNTPSQYYNLLQYAKNTIMSGYPTTSLANKMVLCENWGEFGEGHSLAPCNTYGFGYIDAIRKAFTTASENHLDVIPDGPFDALYSKGWKKELLQNADMEAGTANWAQTFWGGLTTIASSEFRFDSTALKSYNRYNQYSGIAQDITKDVLEYGNGATYELSAYIKQLSGTKPAKVYVQTKDDNGIHYFTVSGYADDSTYTILHGEVKITWTGNLQYAVFNVRGNETNADEFYVDECSMRYTNN